MPSHCVCWDYFTIDKVSNVNLFIPFTYFILLHFYAFIYFNSQYINEFFCFKTFQSHGFVVVVLLLFHFFFVFHFQVSYHFINLFRNFSNIYIWIIKFNQTKTVANSLNKLKSLKWIRVDRYYRSNNIFLAKICFICFPLLSCCLLLYLLINMIRIHRYCYCIWSAIRPSIIIF